MQSRFHQSRLRAVCNGFGAEDADTSGASRRHRIGRSRAGDESFFNQFQPFVRATATYLLAFVALGMYGLTRSIVWYRSAAVLLVLGYLAHTLGLLVEMMLEGRPPVTNVYASIIFGGWIVMSIAGVVERWRRNRVGLVAAAVAGVTTLAAAHVLAPGGVAEIARAATDIGLWLTTLLVVLVFAAAETAGNEHHRDIDSNKARYAVRRPSWYSLARRPS